MELDFTKITDGQPAEVIPEVLPAEKRRAGRPKGVKNGPNALTRGPSTSPLTREERKACHELLTGCSKAEAIRRAYGGTIADPNKYAYFTFNKPRVKVYLQQIQEKQLQKVDLRAEEIIERLRLIGLSKPTDFVTFENGKVRLKPADQIPEESLAALHWEIKEAVTKDGDRVKLGFIRPHDPIKALELLGKNLGIFTEKVEVGVRPIFTFGGDDGQG